MPDPEQEREIARDTFNPAETDLEYARRRRRDLGLCCKTFGPPSEVMLFTKEIPAERIARHFQVQPVAEMEIRNFESAYVKMPHIPKWEFDLVTKVEALNRDQCRARLRQPISAKEKELLRARLTKLNGKI